MNTRPRLASMAISAALYFAVARLALAASSAADHVTLAFAAPGVAVAVLLLSGLEMWPAILLGAFLANSASHQPTVLALAIAGGNTLEAVVAARLLRRFAGIDRRLDRVRQVIGLVSLGAVASTTIGATIGVTSLCLSGVQPWTAFGQLWLTWWTGGAASILLIVPPLLTWHVWRDVKQLRIRDAALMSIGLVTTIAVMCAAPASTFAAIRFPPDYLGFPFLIWAATRFGIGGAAGVDLLMTSLAVWTSVHNLGPDAVAHAPEHLLLQQGLVVIVAATGLLIGASSSERAAALKRRDAEHAVTRVLADAAGAEEAATRIIDVINANLRWDVGVWWSVDVKARRLQCAEVRCCGATRLPQFEHVTRARALDPGEWLPGHVWAYAAPQWIPDVLKEHRSARLRAASADGIRGAFAFPVSVGNEVVGVFEFCSRQVRFPDDDLLWMFNAIGAQVGQFLARKRMEEQIRESEARKAATLDAALDCVVTADEDGRILEFNPAAERTFGYRSEEIIGQLALDVLIPTTERERCLEQLERYRTSQHEGVTGRRLEVIAVRVDGTKFPAEVSITRISSARGPLFSAFLRDITRQKRRANQLAFRATHDGLTKLLNRSAFMDRLKEALAHAREVGSSIALFFIDLDQFKGINDSYGHLVGDRLLMETARRLRRCVRPGDAVARLGGDEFAIVLERVIDVDAVSAMANRVAAEFDRPFAVSGTQVTLSASIGIAMNERAAERPDDLIRAADAAMYRVKASNAGQREPLGEPTTQL